MEGFHKMGVIGNVFSDVLPNVLFFSVFLQKRKEIIVGYDKIIVKKYASWIGAKQVCG